MKGLVATSRAILTCILALQALLAIAPQSVSADTIGLADAPRPTGFRITEKGAPGAVLDIFLSMTFGGRHVTLVKPDRTPWSLTIGADGTATMSFSGQIDVRIQNTDIVVRIPATAIEDFDQFLEGTRVRVGGGAVEITADAEAALQGAFLGSGPVFAFSALADNLPPELAFVPAPDFLTDLNGDGTIASEDDIFVAVNLSQWTPVASTFPFGTQFSITNGLSPDLPGYYFSLTPITVDPSLGFRSGDPFSGTAFAVAEHDLSPVPEPSTLLLFGGGGLGLIGRLLRRRRQNS